MSDSFETSPDFRSQEDRVAYHVMVLRVVAFYSPECSDYQIWRGICGDPLDIEYPRAINLVLRDMALDGAVIINKKEGFPHNVYAITDKGFQTIQSATQS